MGKKMNLLHRITDWDFLVQAIILLLIVVGGVIYMLVT